MINSNNELRITGLNNSGRFGDGTTTNVGTPPNQKIIATDVQVAHGANSFVEHMLYVDTAGDLFYAGAMSSNKGFAANGGTTVVGTPNTFIQTEGVNFGSGVQQLTGGAGHKYLIDADGALWFWGEYASVAGGGVRGDGVNADSYVPVQVVGSKVVKAFGGPWIGFYIDVDGDLYATGQNTVRQFGIITGHTNTWVEVRTNVVDLARSWAGGPGDCCVIIKTDGTCEFAGSGEYNGMGNLAGMAKDAGGYTWQAVPGLTNIVKVIPVGSYGFFALDSSGNLYSWGEQLTSGALGRGNNNDEHDVGIILTDVHDMINTSDGCLAIKTNGQVFGCGPDNGDRGDDGLVESGNPLYVMTYLGYSLAVV